MGKASRTKRERPSWGRDAEMTSLVSRLASHEALVESHCPGGLAELEKMRFGTRPGQQDWPAWCWVPTGISDSVVASLCRPGLDEQTRRGVGEVMGFVSAWRQGKGIYRLSPDFSGQLHSTILPDALPGEVLLQLPEWCVYVPLRAMAGVVGAYVRLDWDQQAKRPLLGILFDMAPDAGPDQSILVNLDVFLDHPSLSSALSELVANDLEARDQLGDVPTLAAAAWPFVDVALYLCSMDADAVAKQRPAAVPRRVPRPSEQPCVWDVGYRVADLLRRPGSTAAMQATAEHPSPTPHMRRAHWHTYLVGRGSRRDPSSARRELRWVHPTLVGAGERAPVVRHLPGEL